MGYRKRILVADDDEINIDITIRLLKHAGYDADSASNGAEAVAATERTAYDLILMDCEMPEMDGYSAARELRSRGFDRPILALSAHTFQPYRERARAHGMSDFVAKPFTGPGLVETIDKWLGGMPQGDQRDQVPAPPSPAPAGEVDFSVVERLKMLESDGNEGLVRSVVDHFQALSIESLDEMRRSASAADSKALKKCAHKLKSAGGNLGARRVIELCDSIERSHLQKNSFEELIEELHRAVKAAHDLIASELERFPQSP